MKSSVALLALDVALASLGIMLAIEGRTTPALSIFAGAGLLGAWQLILVVATAQANRELRIKPFFHGTHYVQGLLQATIYVYLSLYWDAVAAYAPLILAQAIVGYLCEILLAWSRGRTARIGFGIVPVVLSTNLFLWFKDEYFYCQLSMIVLAFFSKEFLTWNYDGRRRHIFNPSAFPLAVVSILLLATGTVGLTRGVDLVASFDLPPNFYEVIFLLGLVTQALYLTTPVSMGAVASLCLCCQAFTFVFGGAFRRTPIPIQVFLGLTFLVTDPATSPKSSLGKFLFGFAYGIGVSITYILLRLAVQPAYFDKLLVVPLVNLLVPRFDWLSTRVENVIAPALVRCPKQLPRFGWLGAYLALFMFLIPILKDPPVGPFGILPRNELAVSNEIKRLLINRQICKWAHPDAYKPFGILYELSNISALRKIYREGRGNSMVPS